MPSVSDRVGSLWSRLLSQKRSFQEPLSESDTDQAIQQILFDSSQAEYEAFHERDVELVAGKENNQRIELIYYPTVRIYGNKQDELFAQYQPTEYALMQEAFEPCETRWTRATAIAEEIQNELHLGSPALGGIVDCRAKSLFSIWEKQNRFNLDPDEIFDTVGIRITVKDKTSARRLKQRLLDLFPTIPPHKFRHIEKTHNPIEDRLDTPNESGFASIRMNLIHPLGCFEIQIQTLADYLKWRQHERETFQTLAASPKYGPFIDPE